MESILARALEYTLKYWLKSFSRDQFKLQGRTVQLSNLDINGDALHSSVGFPPALNVTTAKVGKLEIMLPSVSNVQVEPIVVQIDRLDLVLEENSNLDTDRSPSSTPTSASSGKGSGYGFADKIADGMTVEIHTVNLLLETRGCDQGQGGATWAPPLASITIRNLLLYTTDENWQVVNLKEARDFSSNKKYIYVFKKLEWESLSIDLLPHPDMFMDANLACSREGGNQRDDDGAKRVFFGGERFIEGISGQAYITVQRTELNSPLGLEVQLHITEAVCPALSEPGLRALLRFLTGLYVCLNRGDVDPKAQQRSTEAAGRSLVSIVVDHIFLCIKDAEFQLELLMQSLLFSRASVSDGENDDILSRVMIGGIFLRDTFSRPPCTLVQPSMQSVTKDLLHTPEFARSFCPPIYPLGEQQWQLIDGVPVVCLHSLQIKPSPVPPSFASETVVECQPLMIHLQEESCLRICSFLADGIVVNPGAVLPNFSVNSFILSLKELDLTVPLDTGKLNNPVSNTDSGVQSSFSGARLHIESLIFSESPSLKLRLLNLEKDPACFCLWEDQLIDASQKKWTTKASHLSLSLETCTGLSRLQNSLDWSSGLWRCVELKDVCIEVAMATADGSPLADIPPPGGIVRVGVACEQYTSNTSVEQLFFILDLYVYFGRVSDKIAFVGKSNRPKRSRNKSSGGRLMDKVPSDTAVSLEVKDFQLRFLETSVANVQGMPLVQFLGDNLFIKVTHRTLGGAIAVSSTLCWESVQVDCVDTEGKLVHGNGSANNQNIPHMYRQDVVKSNSSGMIGIVTEVAGDTDSDSSINNDEDEDDDSDDEDNNGENEEEDGDGNSNANGDSDSDGEGGGGESGPLPADQVRVLWMDKTESTISLNDVAVVDRGFLHGDFVATALDPTGQVGVVVNLSTSVDLLSSDGSIMKDISSKDLKRIRDFTVGDYVILGPWLGKIEDVLDNVTVLFDDGSVCKVPKVEPLKLKPISKNILEDGHFPYYPGQRVRASSSSLFKNSRWLSGLWKPNRLEGTVIKVTVGSVFIDWITSASYGPNSSTPPAEEQSPKNLKLLSCFSHTNWLLGDWCILPKLALSSSIPLDSGLSKLELQHSINCELDSTQMGSGCDSEEVSLEESDENNESMDLDPVDAVDGIDRNFQINEPESSSCCSSLSVSKEPVHESWPLHRKKICRVVVRRDKKARKKEESFEKALLIVNTRTKVDVAWQDGTTGCGLDSTSLIPIDSPGDHEFVAEQYVVEKVSDDGDDVGEVRRVGVVKSVNGKERTACVRWLQPVAQAEDPQEFDKEEIVSVYELEGHPDYDYCYGDVVVRLSPVSVSSETAAGMDSVPQSKQQNRPNEIRRDVTKHSGCRSVEDSSGNKFWGGFSDLSWVGNITGLRNGGIEVTWADEMVSTVGPQAIYVVGRDDDSVAAGSEVSDDATSWETVNDNEMDTLENVQEEDELHNANYVDSEPEKCGENSSKNTALSVPLAAFRFVSRLATGIFSLGQKNLDPCSLDSKVEGELESIRTIQISEGKDSSDEYSSQKPNIIDSCGTEIKEEQDISEAHELFEVAEASCDLRAEESNAPAYLGDDICCFKHFDIAKNPVDHYFLGAYGQNDNGRRWFKKVQQDWSILQNNLPDTIYVRVYEDRMDLLRAVIVGAYGTPYQDGLFFFDFHLPPEYPDAPPLVSYHSGGWRINPNLYEDGKVCLSLLNTWTGKGNEVWDPKSSSILQVLVSLQGLVLNSKPYFNEAGYDKQIGTAEGEKNSLSCNENTFLLNCKTMMYLMRRPPKDFEELVKDHFSKRGYYILKACDAYMKGCLVGSLTEDASVSDKNNVNSTSVGFKLMLAKILPKLFLLLSGVGADCHEFKHLLQSFSVIGGPNIGQAN